MPFDGITIHALTDEIKSIVINNKIDKIHQPEKDEIILHIRHERKNYKLLLSADSNLPYFGLTELKKENPTQAPMFCMLLRKHLSGGRITNFEQLELERVIILTVESFTELGDLTEKKLIFEIMGKHSNITLVDENNKIIDCIKRIALGVNRYRQLFPGITYLYPPNTKKDPREENLEGFLKAFDQESLPLFKFLYLTYQGISPIVSKEICLEAGLDFNIYHTELSLEDKKRLGELFLDFFKTKHKDFQVVYTANKGLRDLTILNLTPYKDEAFNIRYFNTVIETVNEYYANKNTVNKLLQRSHDLRKSIQSKIDRQKKKMHNLEEDLLYAETADNFKIKGELILANLYRIEKGMNKVVVENYYNNNEPITLKLDIRLSPADNAQVFFKKYNKLKTAQHKVIEQLEITENEILYLEQVLHNLEDSQDHTNFEEIKEELIQTGYLKKKQTAKKKKTIKNPPYTYVSSDGFEILVGKNNLQNDYLTLKLAHKQDIWLHTQSIPGSHVIIRTEHQEVPESTMREAAMIAAYHSKGKSSSQVPVDYTLIKNIKKPNGAKPGMVIFSTHATLYTTPDENIVRNLKK